LRSASEKLLSAGFDGFDRGEPFALIHPTAAFETKQWGTENFARVAEDLRSRNLTPIVAVAPNERRVADQIASQTSAPIPRLYDLSLPEVNALASRARLFVGNDSGIAHIAAAAGAPCVVIFGSSNRNHWRPWTTKPNEIVFEELPCQPCPGYFCGEFEKPECILRVPVERVISAIGRVIKQAEFQEL
jgi:heptosyltransferase-2/heptosyltransferase-3